MDALIQAGLQQGGPYFTAVVTALAVIGAMLYRGDLFSAKQHDKDLEEKDKQLAAKELQITEWKAIAIKSTDTASTSAIQVKSLTETVETLTELVSRADGRSR